MLDSYELVEVAIRIMISAAGAAAAGLIGMFLGNGVDSRGSLAKPITVIALGLLMVGVFLDYYYF